MQEATQLALKGPYLGKASKIKAVDPREVHPVNCLKECRLTTTSPPVFEFLVEWTSKGRGKSKEVFEDSWEPYDPDWETSSLGSLAKELQAKYIASERERMAKMLYAQF